MTGTRPRRQNPALWITIIFTMTALSALLIGGGLLYLAKNISNPFNFTENEVVALIEAEDWEELERMADEYRGEPVRDAYGNWKINTFYGSLSDLEYSRNRIEMQMLIDKIGRWREAMPESRTAQLMHAQAHSAMAWMARGGGYSNTVSERDWEIFHSHTDTAWKIAEPLSQLPNAEVSVYESLLDLGIARNAPREKMEELLAAGRAINPEFDPLYKTFAWYLFPRWHGKHGDVHKFALRVLDEEGEERYAQLGHFILRRDDGIINYMFLPDPYINGLNILIDKYPYNREYRDTLFSALQWFGRKEEAEAFLDTYGDEYDLGEWSEDEWGAWLLGDGPFPGNDPLHLAVLEDNPARIRALLSEGADIDGKSNGNTPLTQAVEGFREELVGTLLELGASPDIPDDEGRTALHIAADYGQLQSVEYLLNGGADVNATANDGWTALHYAANDGNAEIVRLLLGAESIRPNMIAGEHTTPLMLACERGKEEACLALLADPRVNAAYTTPNSRSTPLHYAVKTNDAEVIRALLGREEVRPNAQDSAACTPLMRAVQNEMANSVRVLLQDNRVDVNIPQQDGNTPLIEAAIRGHRHIVSLLLASEDINVNARGGTEGRTALHHAAEEGHLDAVEAMLDDVRIEMELRTDAGATALDLARKNGHAEVVEMLEGRAG